MSWITTIMIFYLAVIQNKDTINQQSKQSYNTRNLFQGSRHARRTTLLFVTATVTSLFRKEEQKTFQLQF